MTKKNERELCAICGCLLNRKKGVYAKPTVEGRSHATKHHCIAERFFGRSRNKKHTARPPIFKPGEWKHEGEAVVLCYDCHEELLHNPVLLPEELDMLAKLASMRGLSEDNRTDDRTKLGGRIKLLHEAVHLGLESLLRSERG